MNIFNFFKKKQSSATGGLKQNSLTISGHMSVTSYRFPLVLLMLLSGLIFLCWSLIRLYQVHEYHQHISSHRMITNSTFGSHETPEALLANAVLYGEQEQYDKALATYAKLITVARTEPEWQRVALFNSANLYLKRATGLLEKEGLPAWDMAGPLVALAKESYQKALRIKPDWSEAKYNYQLALRLAPTTHGMRGPQQYEDDTIKQEEKPSGWPAMPGNPRGMP